MLKIINKKVILLITILIVALIAILYTINIYLLFDNNKNNNEKNNKALIDYYKIASIDKYIYIEKKESENCINYTYYLQYPNSNKKDIREMVKRELTLHHNVYLSTHKNILDIMETDPYVNNNFPQEIMDNVDSGVKFYHPNNPADNELQNDQALNYNSNYKQTTLNLSFDKPYSISQVQNLLSSYGNITWLWVDTYKGQDISHKVKFTTGEYHDWSYDGATLKPIADGTIGQVFGIKLIDEQNHIIKNPDETFIEMLNKYNNIKDSKVAEKIYQVKESIKKDGPITKGDIRIIGCVINCSGENLSKIKDLSFVRGINIDRH